MTDNSQATLASEAGTVRIEGQRPFVTDCVTKLRGPNGAVEDPSALLDQSVGHAWDWFALHASQRMQAVNFFLLAAAFLTAAYVSAIQYAHPVVAIGVACLGVLFCLVFYAFELRIRELIKTGEKALEQAQEKLAAITGLAEFEICKRVDKPRHPITSYHRVIRGLYALTAITFVVGAGYALHLAGHPVGTDFPLLANMLNGLALVIGGVLSLFWGQRLIRNQLSPRWLSYLFAAALAATGIFVLVSSSIRSLK